MSSFVTKAAISLACVDNLREFMATASWDNQKEKKKNNTSLPPKRGQIKAQIFESIAETLSSAASRAGEAFGHAIKRGGEDAAEAEAGNSSGSEFNTPPSSAYPSDGYAQHA